MEVGEVRRVWDWLGCPITCEVGGKRERGPMVVDVYFGIEERD